MSGDDDLRALEDQARAQAAAALARLGQAIQPEDYAPPDPIAEVLIQVGRELACNGRIDGMTLAFGEVSEARTALAALRAENARLRAALAEMLESFDLLDREAVAHFKNPTLQGVIRGAFLDAPAKSRAALREARP